MKLIEVVWIDSESTSEGWVLNDTVDEFAATPLQDMLTVGYLHTDAEEHIVLVQSWGADAMGAPLKIPRVAIREVRELFTPEAQEFDTSMTYPKGKV